LTPAFFRVNMKKDVADFISTLFHSSTVTHFMHLSTDSYAVRTKLWANTTLPLLNWLTVMQRLTRAVTKRSKTFLRTFTTPKTLLSTLTSIKDYVYKNRDALPDDSQLQNIVDEIAALIDSTIYLLSFK
jgi:hypothetical protein